MLADVVFFSLAQITDPSAHRAYNEWHQLDHRPENLALDGVRHGERWVRTPECAESGAAAEGLAGTHYVNMYWFRDPWATSFAEWQGLAERSYRWGRRPELDFTARPMMGLFRSVRGLAARRVLVSPDAVPFRPGTGVHLRLYRFEQAHAPATHEFLRDVDRIRTPELLATPGVAGVWTFSSVSTTIDPSYKPIPGSATFDPAGADAGLLHAELVFLDGPPFEVQRALNRLPAAAPGAGTEIFRSLLLPIRAWDWDWFDEA